MFPCTIRMNIQTLVIVFVLTFVCGQDRTILSKLNPGCQDCTSEETLIYIQAKGSHDIIHQIWDFTRGVPTIIFVVAGVNSTLNITWENMTPNNFWFSEKPKYSFAVAFDKLYEYDDLEDNGHIDDRSPRNARPLAHVSWARNETVLTGAEAMVRMRGKFLYADKWRTDAIEIKLDLLPFSDYAAELPHLIHSANSTLVDMSLVELSPSRGYNASRFAAHATLAATEPRADTLHCLVRKSLDDEHTPGVFEIIEIKTPESYKNDDGGFIQFRPVAYTGPERGVGTSTIAHVTDFNRTTIPESSTLGRFYRGYDRSNLLVQDTVVSFGEAGDGFYKQHNYTSWSFTIGYGAPPDESFSLFVLLVISIGLGAPAALALSAAAYLLVRRARARARQRRAGGPQRFTDDE